MPGSENITHTAYLTLGWSCYIRKERVRVTELQTEMKRRSWQEIDQLIHDWGGFCVYDDPYEAIRLGTILSPCQLSKDEWHRWTKEHYVGDSGYNHETGEIVNEKQREFFNSWYPNWNEEQGSLDEDDDVAGALSDDPNISLNYLGGWEALEL